MKREPGSSSDLFGLRQHEIRPLTDRLSRRAASGVETPAVAGGASAPVVRSIFQPPPAEPPPPPPPPSDDPEVQRQLQVLRRQAEEAGLRDAEARVQAVVERYLEAIRALSERAEKTRPQASEVVSLAMVVAREIVGRELRVDGEPLVTALDEALRQVGTQPAIVVRLGREDLEYVKRRRPELPAAGVELVLDESLGAGGCIVEAPDQIVDNSVESRLAAARDAVAGALDRDHDEPEPAGSQQDVPVEPVVAEDSEVAAC